MRFALWYILLSLVCVQFVLAAEIPYPHQIDRSKMVIVNDTGVGDSKDISMISQREKTFFIVIGLGGLFFVLFLILLICVFMVVKKG